MHGFTPGEVGPRLPERWMRSVDSAGLQPLVWLLMTALEINGVWSECQPEHAKSQVVAEW